MFPLAKVTKQVCSHLNTNFEQGHFNRLEKIWASMPILLYFSDLIPNGACFCVNSIFCPGTVLELGQVGGLRHLLEGQISRHPEQDNNFVVINSIPLSMR